MKAEAAFGAFLRLPGVEAGLTDVVVASRGLLGGSDAFLSLRLGTRIRPLSGQVGLPSGG